MLYKALVVSALATTTLALPHGQKHKRTYPNTPVSCLPSEPGCHPSRPYPGFPGSSPSPTPEASSCTTGNCQTATCDSTDPSSCPPSSCEGSDSSACSESLSSSSSASFSEFFHRPSTAFSVPHYNPYATLTSSSIYVSQPTSYPCVGGSCSPTTSDCIDCQPTPSVEDSSLPTSSICIDCTSSSSSTSDCIGSSCSATSSTYCIGSGCSATSSTYCIGSGCSATSSTYCIGSSCSYQTSSSVIDYSLPTSSICIDCQPSPSVVDSSLPTSSSECIDCTTTTTTTVVDYSLPTSSICIDCEPSPSVADASQPTSFICIDCTSSTSDCIGSYCSATSSSSSDYSLSTSSICIDCQPSATVTDSSVPTGSSCIDCTSSSSSSDSSASATSSIDYSSLPSPTHISTQPHQMMPECGSSQWTPGTPCNCPSGTYMQSATTVGNWPVSAGDMTDMVGSFWSTSWFGMTPSDVSGPNGYTVGAERTFHATLPGSKKVQNITEKLFKWDATEDGGFNSMSAMTNLPMAWFEANGVGASISMAWDSMEVCAQDDGSCTMTWHTATCMSGHADLNGWHESSMMNLTSNLQDAGILEAGMQWTDISSN